MSTHTQRPWNTRKGFEGGTIEIFRPNKSIKKPFYPTEIAVVAAQDKEGKANARLIVAAPDMLEVLEEMKRKLRIDDPLDMYDSVCEAIAKATGELFNTEVVRPAGSERTQS